jgi:predicted transposase/invertase (TIGR01784 family)
MKTDSLFYALFQQFPQSFFDLIGTPDIEPDTYQFISPEIKQSSFRLDGVFLPIAEFYNQPIYFLEIQVYKDEGFYERLFSEIFLYFRQYQPPNPKWYAIVIYGTPSHESPIPERYQSLIEPHLRRFYLNQVQEIENESLARGMVRLIVEREKKTEELSRRLIKRAAEEVSDEIIQQQVIEFIETIVIYKFPNLSREEIETMLNLSLLKETKVYQEAFEEGKEEGKREGKEEGKREGKEEGKRKGKEEGKLEIVPKLRQKGFSIQEIADLLDLDPEKIRQAGAAQQHQQQ